uniref:Uncharacterized protein n=1 Tax=Cacopsylla melanoneura TaxID=428564 RepID=A0A8D9BMC8_9HEMI
MLTVKWMSRVLRDPLFFSIHPLTAKGGLGHTQMLTNFRTFKCSTYLIPKREKSSLGYTFTKLQGLPSRHVFISFLLNVQYIMYISLGLLNVLDIYPCILMTALTIVYTFSASPTFCISH